MDFAISGGTWPTCTSISVPRLIPEQMVRTNASSPRGLRAGSVRSTPCRGAMVQYAVQRSVATYCILSSSANPGVCGCYVTGMVGARVE
jgi:hypothetical protein